MAAEPEGKIGLSENGYIVLELGSDPTVLDPEQARGLGLMMIRYAARADGGEHVVSEIDCNDGSLWRVELLRDREAENGGNRRV